MPRPAQPTRAWVCDAKLVDLGTDGLRIITAQLLDAETLVAVRLPHLDGETAPLSVRGMVYAARRSAGGWQADVRFAPSDDQAKQPLRRFLAAVRHERVGNGQ